MDPETGRWMLEQMDRNDLMRCWYAARDIRVQCYKWPLLDIRDTALPPTARYGSATDITLKMMDSFK